MSHPIHVLTQADKEALAVLSAAVGWQQPVEFCGNVIAQADGHCLGVEYDGQLVGCGAGMRYPGSDVAFLFEIIVHPKYRRRGIAHELVRELQRRFADCPTLRLYATPEGQTVYAGLGFQPYDHLGRYHCDAWDASGDLPSDPGLRPMEPNDLNAILALDLENFGVHRGELLTDLYCRCPNCAFVVRHRGVLEGFVLTRSNHSGKRNISTLQASSPQVALALLAAAGSTRHHPIHLTVDIFERHSTLIDFVMAHQGKKITPMTAMQFGVSLPPPSYAYMAPVGADIG